jgi:NADPH:quinone reductase-like Zn-dependent oxidoreductase
VHAVTIVDGALHWRPHADPEPGAGEILVAVKAAGISNADLLQRAGLYPPPAGVAPDIPGLEAAGEVVGLGPGATRFAVGDRVMAVLAGAGQAELVTVHERAAMPVPDPVPWDQAGAIPENVTTAHDALVTQAGLVVGERLLVHGAAGGVGTAAVMLGAVIGARVVATVRDDAKRAGVDALHPAIRAVAPEDFDQHEPFVVILECPVSVAVPSTMLRSAAISSSSIVAVTTRGISRVTS